MRRTREIIIPSDDPENRDAGKHFLLKEMPASQAEKWAARLFLSLAKSGVEIPENVKGIGIVGVSRVLFAAFGGMRFEDAEPLLDEMFNSCVAIIPDPNRPMVYRGADSTVGRLMEEDIEEVSTRIKLRQEVLDLHTGFFKSAARSTSAS